MVCVLVTFGVCSDSLQAEQEMKARKMLAVARTLKDKSWILIDVRPSDAFNGRPISRKLARFRPRAKPPFI